MAKPLDITNHRYGRLIALRCVGNHPAQREIMLLQPCLVAGVPLQHLDGLGEPGPGLAGPMAAVELHIVISVPCKTVAMITSSFKTRTFHRSPPSYLYCHW